ncbi:uncharacterized protein METZ01_LOCUS197350, partial [marine metagenome]
NTIRSIANGIQDFGFLEESGNNITCAITNFCLKIRHNSQSLTYL